MKTGYFSEFRDWNLLNFLTFRREDKNKQKEHNIYTTSLGMIIATGSCEQQLIAIFALNGFTVNYSTLTTTYQSEQFVVEPSCLIRTVLGWVVDDPSCSDQEVNTDEVKDFWRGVESDRNTKEYETFFEDLDFESIVKRTLENNGYIEVGQRRKQVMECASEIAKKCASEINQEEEFIDSNKSNKSNYSLRKRQRVNYNEKEMFKRQCQDRETSPSPRQPAGNLLFDNSHESYDFDTGIASNCPAIINDVVGLQLGPLPQKESRWLINNIDISEKWHLFKEKSLELANREGLFVLITYSFVEVRTKLPVNSGNFWE
ncbi:8190_t:CDS:2 [Cetraspora pellucida]|uniref:8190_t:CDS:1 n=1 Tax=Cetraspora pellucida TaxID=1433469 RepID=A0ACA9PJF0_9GLOM|nr:8190_t:CDS:2 [Cetraspora pellucida]